jgi:murein DD-endopeptidase MepM/ murein hydrolase activator NlpD
MSYRTGASHYEHDRRAYAGARAAGSSARRQGTRGSGYTLAHAGRQLRLGPIAFWVAVGTLMIMAAWSVGTATYFAFRDDVLTRLIARQAQMQFAYEDRIADLRAQVDRVTSRQLLDQDQFEQKLDQIFRRQAILESRASALNNVPDPSPTGSIRPNMRSPLASEPASSATPKPSPISDTVIFVAPPDREARLESRNTMTQAPRPTLKTAAVGIEGVLARLQTSLDRVEARQAATLNAMEESFDAKARRMRGVLADLGLDVGKTPPAATAAPVGGPFVPVKPNNSAGAFERQLYRINLVRANVDRLSRVLGTVPVRKPVAGELDTTSGFGVRMDPFIRAPAMHTGLDFRGSVGDPIRATAAGTVSSAGTNGGYGKMVEIDHGNGLSTRYAHLSEIEVTVGQHIRIGQIVGRLGSTGRSTGPHLHYETRMEGEAVDPQKFLRAGIRLGSL